jgi:hypothetical protein
LILIWFLRFSFAAIRRIILACWLDFKMAEIFNWFRPGYDLVTVRLQWKVKVPFLQTADRNDKVFLSPLFFPQETPNSKWVLRVNYSKTQIAICTYHCDSAGKNSKFRRTGSSENVDP